MNEWKWASNYACHMYKGDRGNVWVRKYPNQEFGLGGLAHLNETPEGWYFCHTFTYDNNDWAYIPNVTTEEEAKAVALMLVRMR